MPQTQSEKFFEQFAEDAPATSEQYFEQFAEGGPVTAEQFFEQFAEEPTIDFLGNFNTKLSPDQERNFQFWLGETKQKYGRDLAPDLESYDLRGYWLNPDEKIEGFRQGKEHAPDTYKKPNHPTFSNESIYHGVARGDGRRFIGGSWKGETFIPPKQEDVVGVAEKLPETGRGIQIPGGPVDPKEAMIRESLRSARLKRIEEDLKMVNEKLKAGETSPTLFAYRDQLHKDAAAMLEDTQRDIEALKDESTWGRLPEAIKTQYKESMLGGVAQITALLSGGSARIPIAPGLGAISVNPLATAKAAGVLGPEARSIPAPFMPAPDVAMESAKEGIRELQPLKQQQERLKPTAFLERLAWDALESSPSLATAMAATIAAGPIGGFAATFALEGGSTYADFVARGVDSDTALTTSIGVGAINAALEQLGATQVLKAIGKPKLANAVEAAVEKGFIRRSGTAMLSEGAEETAQNLTQVVAQMISEKDRTFEMKDLTEALYAGLVGAVMGGGATITGTAGRKAIEKLHRAINPSAYVQVKRGPDGTANIINIRRFGDLSKTEPILGKGTLVAPDGTVISAEEAQAQAALEDRARTLSKYIVSQVSPSGTPLTLLPSQAGESVSGMRTIIGPDGRAVVTVQPVETQTNRPAPKVGQQGSIVSEGIYEQGAPKSTLPKTKVKGLQDKIDVKTGEYVYPEEGPARDRAIVGELLRRTSRFLKNYYGEDIPAKDSERQDQIVKIMQAEDAVKRSGELAGHFISEGILDIASSVEVSDASRQKATGDLLSILGDFNRLTGNQVVPSQLQNDPKVRAQVGNFVGIALTKWINEGNQAGISPEMQSVIRRFINWMKDKYEAIRGRGYHISPQMEQIFKQIFDYDKSTVTNVRADGSKVTAVSLNYNEGFVQNAGTEKNIWIRQSMSKENKGRTLLIQISSRLLLGDAQYDISERYYDQLYRNRPGYDRTADFWEIPFWIAQVGTVDENSDVLVVRNMEEARKFLAEAGYGRIAFSALDINVKFLKDLISVVPAAKVTVGGYVKNLRDEFAGLKNVETVDTVEDFAKSIGVTWSPNYSYRHFKGTGVIPRLTMSKGCRYQCAFCTVPSKIVTMPKESIDRQVESIVDLQSKLVYLDDKTFGQATNYQYLKEIYGRIKEVNPDFEGFIVQTTAPDVLKMDEQWLRDSGIKYVEIGVESFNDDILKKTHKPARERNIQEAADKLRRTGIAMIPNLIVGLRGKNADGTTWEETAETYQHTIDFLNRNADIISHLNVYNLALYEGTELANQVDSKISGDQNNENILSASLYKNPEVHQRFHDDVIALGMRLLDKEPTFPRPIIQEPGQSITEYPTVRNANNSREYTHDIITVDQMRYVLGATGVETAEMSETEVRAKFGELPPILRKAVDEEGRIMSNAAIISRSEEERQTITDGGGSNFLGRIMFGEGEAAQFDDPLTGSTIYVVGPGPVTEEQVRKKIAESRDKQWPITNLLRQAGMPTELLHTTTPGHAASWLKWHVPQGWDAVVKEMQVRLRGNGDILMGATIIPGLSPKTIQALLEPVIVESVAQANTALRAGKINFKEFQQSVKDSILRFAENHPELSKLLDQIKKWLATFTPEIPKSRIKLYHYSKAARPMLSTKFAGTAQAGEERRRADKVIHFYGSDSKKVVERRFWGDVKHVVFLDVAFIDLASPQAKTIIDEVRKKNHGAFNLEQVIAEFKRQGYDGMFNTESGNPKSYQYWGKDVYPAVVDGKTNPAYTKNEMLSDEHVDRILSVAQDFPGGVTIDPRTGERVTSKELGDKHVFVGLGADIATAIKVKTTSELSSKKVRDAVMKILKKHHGLLANNSNYFIGTWFSAEEGMLVIDLAKRTDLETGLVVGEWLDQKTVGVLPEIERLENLRDELTKAGMSEEQRANLLYPQEQKAFPKTYGKDKFENISDLPTDPVERWKEAERRARENFVSISQIEKPGATEAVDLSTLATKEEKDAAKQKMDNAAAAALMAGVLGQGAVPKPLGARARRITNTLIREFPNMLKDLVGGMEWYGKNLQGAIDILKENYPGELTESDITLFKAILAVTSGASDPDVNWQNAMKVFRFYKGYEKLPTTIADHDQLTLDEEKMGRGSVFGEVRQAMAMLDNLIKKEGSIEAAYEWLSSIHPAEEVDRMAKAKGGAWVMFPDRGKNGSTYGAMILGKKRGSFFLNLVGNPDMFTMDRHEARLARLIVADLLKADQSVVDSVVNGTWLPYVKAFTRAAESVGLDTRDYQAVTWLYFKELWKEFGGYEQETTTYLDAAKKWAESTPKRKVGTDVGGIEPGQEGAPAEAGGPAPEPGDVRGILPEPSEGNGGGPYVGAILVPGIPQLTRLIELAAKALAGPRVQDPQIRAELKRFAQHNGLPPPPETLSPRDIDKYVSTYLSNSIKKQMGGTMQAGFIPGVTPAMMEAFAEKLSGMAAISERTDAARKMSRKAWLNIFRATALAQIMPKFGKIYREAVSTDGDVKRAEQAVLDLVSKTFEGLNPTEAARVTEAVYTGNERQEVYTDIELAAGVMSAVGQQVLPPMSAREIAAYRAIRAAQDAVLDIRKNTILFHESVALATKHREIYNYVPGTPQFQKAEKQIADIEERIRTIENYYQSLKDQGYVTLKRSGKWAVVAEDPTKGPNDPDRLIYDHAENLSQVKMLKQQFEKQGFTAISHHEVRKLPVTIAQRLSPAEFDEVLSRAGIDPSNVSKDLQDVRDQLLSRYATSSYTLRRKFVRGYKRTPQNLKESMIGQLNNYSLNAFRSIGRVRAMQALNDSGLRESDPELYDFSVKYIEDEFSPQRGGLVAGASSYARRSTYIMQLAGDIGQLFLNAFAQPVTVTYPYFARAEFNMKGTDAEKYFMRGAKLAAQSAKNNGPKDFLALVDRGTKEDVLGSELTQSIVDQERGKVGKVMHVASFFSRMGEKITRRHAFAEAYLVGSEKMGLKGEELYQFMKNAVAATQGRWSGGENPGMVRALGEPGRALYQFQSFQQIWIENMALAIRDAHKNKVIPGSALRQIIATAALAGLSGLPAAGLVKMLIAALTGDDPEKWMKKNVVEDKEMINLALYGLSGHPGISSRMGIMSNVIDTEVNGPTEALNPLRFMAAFSTLEQVYSGVSDIARGDYLRGAEGVLPRALRGPVRAVRFAKEGARDRAGEIVASKRKIGEGGVVLQALGVTPGDVVRYYEKKRLKTGLK